MTVPEGAAEAAALRHAGDAVGLSPELVRAEPGAPAPDCGERIAIAQLGRRERSHWGPMRVLRGIEAVRGACFARTALTGLDILVDGIRIHRAALPPAADVAGCDGLRRHVFNAWIDCSTIPPGRHALELRLFDEDGTARVHHEHVLIGPPFDAARFADSDGILALPPGAGTLDERIAAQPTMVRAAGRRPPFPPPRAVLVQRMDQLGDLVVSVPALRRLRTLFGQARLVGLVTPANAGLARTLGLFDDVVIADFPEDPHERRRVMPLAGQAALRDRLAPYRFDIAIDLSESTASRALLPLSGAPFLYGFGSGEFGYLSAQVEGYTHDRANRHETVPHATKLMALVEWLATLLADHAGVVRRPDLSRDRLAAYGIAPDDRFVVLHDGARLPFTRWPHYPALAAMLRDRTACRVVLMSDGPVPPDAPDDGIVRIGGRIPFDDFDALLSFCDGFVGNDSGPKHLAALRGAAVVSLHMARNNWNEWGQDGAGVILSRRIPCAGCLIATDPDGCGRGFACLTGIAAEEVFAALTGLMARPHDPARTAAAGTVGCADAVPAISDASGPASRRADLAGE